MGNVIFLNDIYLSRDLKRRELEYYKQQMEMLQERMNLVQREISITDTIIHIIEQEMK